MTHLDVCSGIGGFPLAAQRAGWQTIGLCENDDFCRRVLAKNFPGVPVVRDLRYLAEHADRLRGRVDCLTGGVPCQDVSSANRTAKGFSGSRSGLIVEFLRLASGSGARWVVMENAANAITTYRDELLGLFERYGYAAAPIHKRVDALHARKRSFVIAYPDSLGGSAKVQMVAAMVHDQERKRSPQEQGGIKFLLRNDADPVFSFESEGNRMVAPVFCRAPDAIPDRLDRCRALGNAVVPAVAYQVLRAIAEAERTP